jgi:hypoxanthine phosphoribosyltransferase
MLIAIGRGGYVPARILADYLGLMALTGIKVEHYQGAQKQPVACVKYPLNITVTGCRVLVIDDVSDTGDTFAVTLEHISAFNPAAMRTAALHHKTVSSYRPDYFAEEIKTWRWLIYPWAVIEDISGFIERMEPRPQTVEAAANRLSQDYGLQVPLQTLEDVFQLQQW